MASNKVRVAIIGVGNCASSLVQGVQFYKNAEENAVIPGIMHTSIGGYHIRDVEFTLGIDVNTTKVGKDLSEAIFAEPNNTYKFADVPHLDAPVVRGMTHDGLGKYLSRMIQKAPGEVYVDHLLPLLDRHILGHRTPRNSSIIHKMTVCCGAILPGIFAGCYARREQELFSRA